MYYLQYMEQTVYGTDSIWNSIIWNSASVWNRQRMELCLANLCICTAAWLLRLIVVCNS